MLKFAKLGKVFQMRFTHGDDDYCMVISIYTDKISGTFGYEYSVKYGIDNPTLINLEKFGYYEIESRSMNSLELIMTEILNQAVNNIVNNDIPLDLNEEKIKELYIPLFIRFIKKES